MRIRERCLLGLLVLAFFDVFVPIPIVELMLIYVVLDRPGWFRSLVEQLYVR